MGDDVTAAGGEAAPGPDYLGLTVEVVKAMLSNGKTHVPADRLPDVIRDVHRALSGLGRPVEPAAPVLQPAVPVRSSVHRDHIVCLEDGQKFRSLKRHLHTHGLSPDEYRARWGLPPDYPTVAPGYREKRSELALQQGLGRRPSPAPSDPSDADAPPADAGGRRRRQPAGKTRSLAARPGIRERRASARRS